MVFGVRIRKVFLYIEEYIGIIVVKIKRCNGNLYWILSDINLNVFCDIGVWVFVFEYVWYIIMYM